MQVTILQNIYWKELGLLVFVWVSYLAVQIAKVFFPSWPKSLYHTIFLLIINYKFSSPWQQNYTAPCSTTFWLLNLLQVYMFCWCKSSWFLILFHIQFEGCFPCFNRFQFPSESFFTRPSVCTREDGEFHPRGMKSWIGKCTGCSCFLPVVWWLE